MSCKIQTLTQEVPNVRFDGKDYLIDWQEALERWDNETNQSIVTFEFLPFLSGDKVFSLKDAKVTMWRTGETSFDVMELDFEGVWEEVFDGEEHEDSLDKETTREEKLQYLNLFDNKIFVN